MSSVAPLTPLNQNVKQQERRHISPKNSFAPKIPPGNGPGDASFHVMQSASQQQLRHAPLSTTSSYTTSSATSHSNNAHSLLPSAFELTPPDSQLRKRTVDGTLKYVPATPVNASYPVPKQNYPPPPQFVTPLSTVPGQRVVSAPSALASVGSIQMQKSNSTPRDQIKSNDDQAPDTFKHIRNAPISDYAAYSGYLSRQKKEGGDDSGSVWSKDVEEAFMEALRKIPRVGRRKITIYGRPCGRNELISDYIYQKTGKTRTRKQVSSHIQVLKHLLKSDPEFMSLVADTSPNQQATKVAVVSPIFSKNSAGAREQEAKRQRSGGSTDMFFASPQPKNPVNASLMLNNSGRMSAHPYSLGHHVLPPRSASTIPHPISGSSNSANDVGCGYWPVNFCMWQQTAGARNVFTQLIRPQLETPLKPKSFSNISGRFPAIAEHIQAGRIKCPLIYGKVRLDVSTSGAAVISGGVLDEFRTELQFTAPLKLADTNGSPLVKKQAPSHRWEVITTVETLGRQVLKLVEPVASQQNLVLRSEKLSIPFASDFWAAFIAGFNRPGCNTEDQAETAISAITVVQKLYRVPSDFHGPLDEAELEQLNAVIIYEFEKAPDGFSARSVFRKLIVPETTLHAPVPQPSFHHHQQSAASQYGDSSEGTVALQQPQPHQPSTLAYQDDVFVSPLARHHSVPNHNLVEAPGFEERSMPMSRSFSVAGFGYSDLAHEFNSHTTSSNSSQGELHNYEMDGLNMARSITAFEDLGADAWSGPTTTAALAAATAANNSFGHEEWYHGSNQQDLINFESTRQHANLNVEVTAFDPFDDTSSAPLKSAPPVFRSFVDSSSDSDKKDNAE
ncbi:hypothetical protein TRVA0_022S00474 [Trichomonascus vanleenenianus]|uniref:Tec1p n=1 Tax=Trichomonascus vanleenenianus TaxID=2268995 RepID=UPI003ECA770D